MAMFAVEVDCWLFDGMGVNSATDNLYNMMKSGISEVYNCWIFEI